MAKIKTASDKQFDGKFLKQLRNRHGFSLQELADKIQCSKSYTWELEENGSDPSFSVVLRLSRILGVDMKLFALSGKEGN